VKKKFKVRLFKHKVDILVGRSDGKRSAHKKAQKKGCKRTLPRNAKKTKKVLKFNFVFLLARLTFFLFNNTYLHWNFFLEIFLAKMFFSKQSSWKLHFRGVPSQIFVGFPVVLFVSSLFPNLFIFFLKL
jgi:hypothetical protein